MKGIFMTTRERLARVEGQLEQLLAASVETRAELRAHFEMQRNCLEALGGRVNGLEQSAAQTRTHLRWMKAVWATVQGIVLGVR